MKKENLAPQKSTNGRLLLLCALLLLAIGVTIYSLNQTTPPATPPPAPPPKPAEFSPSPPPAPIPPRATTPTPAAANKPAPAPNPATTTVTVSPPASPALPAPPPVGPAVRIAALANKPTPAAALALEPWKLREEWRELSVSFLDIGTRVRNGEPPPSELEFPLFDGNTITLTDLEYRPQANPNDGAFFAKVKGEPAGGHVLFGYANNALVGTIHVPSKSFYFDIRNNTPLGGAVSQIFLAQLDPAKMPRCGTCQPVPATGGTGTAPTTHAH